MNSPEQWYQEAVSNSNAKIISTTTGSRLFFKGFMISITAGSYEIADTRHSDFYTPVTTKDLEVFNRKGFTLGATYLMFVRDSKRVDTYTRRIASLHALKQGFEEKLSLNKQVEFATKRIRNCEENLEGVSELLEFYTSRRNRIQNKYQFNINE